jgi:EmrB/QacA subfamily drug resistance transporter
VRQKRTRARFLSLLSLREQDAVGDEYCLSGDDITVNCRPLPRFDFSSHLDEQRFPLGNHGTIIQLSPRFDLKSSGRLALHLRAKGQPRAHAYRLSQANFEACRDGRFATEPDRVDHTFIENRRQHSTMGDASEALKTFGHDEGGADSGPSLNLEGELEPIRVVLAAHEATLVIGEFHGAAYGWTGLCDAVPEALDTLIRRTLSTEFHGIRLFDRRLPWYRGWAGRRLGEGRAEGADDCTVKDHGEPNKWLVTAAVVSGTLCIGVTMSMMNLAIPLMLSALQTDIETMQWIITGPMLVNIAIVPLVGWLTTLISTRQVYLWALIIWIITSVPCGLSDTAGGVIFYRLLQGIGGSLHIPTAITVIYHAFPFQQRGLAMGIQQGAQWAAPAIGMTIGGYLLQLHGWRALFFYPIPIGLVSVALALRVIPQRRDGSRSRLDWAGLATLTPALSLLLLAVSQSQRPGWDGYHLLVAAGGGLFGMLVFAQIERRHPSPLLEFTLFRARAFRAASVVYFLNTFIGMGVSFAVIVFLQNILHYSPLQVGFLLLPATLGRGVGELAAGHLSDRWGARGLSLAGLFIFAVSCLALGFLDSQASALFITALLMLGNTGMALSNSPIIHAGLRTLRDDRISIGSGLLSLVRITGGTFGIGMVGPLVAIAARWCTAIWPAEAAPVMEVGEPLLAGYHIYFYLMALLSVCTMIPAYLVQSSAPQDEC